MLLLRHRTLASKKLSCITIPARHLCLESRRVAMDYVGLIGAYGPLFVVFVVMAVPLVKIFRRPRKQIESEKPTTFGSIKRY